MTSDIRKLGSVLGDGLVVVAAGLVLLALLAVVGDVLRHGLGLVDWTFLTAAPTSSGRAGGIGPIIVSTAIVTGIALVVATPLAIGIAILLAEHVPPGDARGRRVRACLCTLAGVPSIVFGLVGNTLFCDWMGLGFSLLAGGLTLALMALPVIAFVAEQAISGAAERLRSGAYALGMTQTRVVMRVILPVALPGIVGGVALGFGRAIAESAALVFTSGYVDRMPGSVFDSGRTLAVHILDLAMNVPGGDPRAYATAAVLMGSMLVVVGGLSVLSRSSQRRMGSLPS